MHGDTYSPGGCPGENGGDCNSLQAFRLYARRRPLAVLAEQLEVLPLCEPLRRQTRQDVYGCADRIASAALRTLDAGQFNELLRGPMATRWPAVGRLTTRSAASMVKIRDHLCAVLDESSPLAERLAVLWPDGRQPLHTCLTTNTVTPFLHVTRPAHYAVWSSEVQQGLAMLGLWPQPASVGGKAGEYLALCDTARRLAEDLRTDLWTLETLLRRVAHFDRVGQPAYAGDAW